MKITINDDPSTTGDAGGYWGFYPSDEHVQRAADYCLAFRRSIMEIDDDSGKGWVRDAVEFTGASFFTAELDINGGKHIKGQPAIRLKVVMNLSGYDLRKEKLEAECSNWDEVRRKFIAPEDLARKLRAKLLQALEIKKAQLTRQGELLGELLATTAKKAT